MSEPTPLELLSRILPQRGPSLSAKEIRAALAAAGLAVEEERLAMLIEYLVAGGMVLEAPRKGRFRQARGADWG